MISRRNQSTLSAHDEFFGTPKRSKTELEQDSLSPRLGLVKRYRAPQPIRFPHTVVHTPLAKLGDLTGNPSYFLEMRSFNMRKMDTHFPEHQFKERGGKTDSLFILDGCFNI